MAMTGGYLPHPHGGGALSHHAGQPSTALPLANPPLQVLAGASPHTASVKVQQHSHHQQHNAMQHQIHHPPHHHYHHNAVFPLGGGSGSGMQQSAAMSGMHHQHHDAYPQPQPLPPAGQLQQQHQQHHHEMQQPNPAASVQQQHHSPAARPQSQTSPTVTPHDVATAFALQYYRMLTSRPQSAHKFYVASSQLTRGSTMDLSWQFVRTVGMDNIDELLQNSCVGMKQALLHTVEGQDSVDGGIIVQITGALLFVGGSLRPFAHTVFLAPQSSETSAPCFFVLNDLFVYIEGAPDQPPTSSAAAADTSTTTATDEIPVQQSVRPASLPQHDQHDSSSEPEAMFTDEVKHNDEVLLETSLEDDSTLEDAVESEELPADERSLNDEEGLHIDSAVDVHEHHVVTDASSSEIGAMPTVVDSASKISAEEVNEVVVEAPIHETLEERSQYNLGSSSAQNNNNSNMSFPAAASTPPVRHQMAWATPTLSGTSSGGPSLLDSAHAAEQNKKGSSASHDLKQRRVETEAVSSFHPQVAKVDASQYAANSYAAKLLNQQKGTREAAPSQPQVGYAIRRDSQNLGQGNGGSPTVAARPADPAAKVVWTSHIPKETTDDVIKKAVSNLLKGEICEGRVVTIDRLANGGAYMTLDSESCVDSILNKGFIYLQGVRCNVERARGWAARRDREGGDHPRGGDREKSERRDRGGDRASSGRGGRRDDNAGQDNGEQNRTEGNVGQRGGRNNRGGRNRGAGGGRVVPLQHSPVVDMAATAGGDEDGWIDASRKRGGRNGGMRGSGQRGGRTNVTHAAVSNGSW